MPRSAAVGAPPRAGRLDDVPAVAALFAAGLGPGYVTDDDVTAAVDDPSQLLVVAEAGGRLVGAATAQTHGRAAPQGLRLPAGRVGWLHQAVVDPGWRRLGVGRAMVHARLDWLAQTGCDHAAVLSWRHGGDTSEGPLARAGFVTAAVLPGWWTADSITAGYRCPADGHPCRCTAVLMTAVLVP